MNIRRAKWVGAAVMAAVVVSSVARADAPEAHTDTEPANGVPFNFRTGFYTELQLGVFMDFGGEKAVSNGQAYEGVSIGYEFAIPSAWSKQISIFLTAAHGPNAGSCRYLTTQGCDQGTTGTDSAVSVNAPENFSTFPIEIGTRLGFHEFPNTPRFFGYIVAVVGYTLVTPQLDPPGSTNFPGATGSPGGSLHWGAGVGIQYGTRLDGLSVGLDVLFRDTIASLSIPSLSIYPRIAYVF